MWNWLRWLFRKPKKDPEKTPPPKDKKITIYPAKEVLFETTEGNIILKPCKVLNDGRLKYGKKEIKIKPDRPPHVLTLPMNKMMPTWFGRRFAPTKLRFVVYTAQKTGEMTHDPHLDQMDPEMKAKFETLLKLQGKFAEAEAGGIIYEGIKGQKKWFDYIPYLVILGIVLLFLLAMTQ